MNRRTARAAALTSLVLAGARGPVAGASAQETEFDRYGNACTVAGSIASPTGLRYAPGEGTYTVAGVMDCTSSKYGHGTLTGKGSGLLGCFGGFSEAVYKVVWSNGEKTTIHTKSGDFTYGTGTYGEVTKGALRGSEVGMMWGRAAAAAEAKCATDAVHSYQFAGGIGFHSHGH